MRVMVQEVASVNGGGPSTATYLISPRGPEYRKDANGVKWYRYDGLGSVLGEVDLNGNLTATKSYDVYGAVRTSAGTSTSKHGFVGSLGHPSESGTGLIYMQARYVDPVLGTFLSEDSARKGPNWFAYCEGNPVCYVDADGKSPINLLDRMCMAFGFMFAMFAITLACMGGFVAAVAFAKLSVALFVFAAVGNLSYGYDKLALFVGIYMAQETQVINCITTLVAMAGKADFTPVPGAGLVIRSCVCYDFLLLGFIIASDMDNF